VLRYAVVDRERYDAENQHNSGDDRQEFSLRGFLCDSVDFSFANSFERSLVEVAVLIGVRIEEETLGAAFHFYRISGFKRIVRI